MTTTYEPNKVLSNKEFKVVGTRPVRPDGADKVTGRAQYGADLQLTGLLYGKTLRSPHAHANIKSIDFKKALALEGVKAVVSAKDFPKTKDTANYGLGDSPMNYFRGNILSDKKVLYKGQAIAAVAATSVHVAEAALSLIDVKYEVLDAVLTAPEGMAKDAPILHDDLFTKEFEKQTKVNSNVAEHFQHKMGDLDKGFAAADVIVERTFDTATVHQGYIEPHNVTALWNDDDRIHVWTSTQGAFTVRAAVSEALAVPVSKIKVTPMEIGGGFGGKINVYEDPAAALLSKKAGHKPVKMVMSRAEVFEGTGPTPGSHISVKIGATNDGKIVAAQADLAMEAGAYPGSPVGAGAMCVFTAYDIDNVTIDGYDVVVNKPKTAAYRAPGAPNAAFAAEQVIDEIAEKLNIDPLELRLQNAAKEGTRRADGPIHPRIGCVEVLEAMKEHHHYQSPLTPSKNGGKVGRGVAIGFWFNIGMQSACNISVNNDGTVNLVEGSTDIGGSRASIAMHAAEVLGISYEDVKPQVADTDSVGYTAITGGSRTTFATGWAAYEAANDVKAQLIDRAATIWGVDPDSVEMEEGVLRSKTDTELNMSFKDLSAQLNDTGGPIVGRGAVDPSGPGGSFCGQIVDVEVDPETGKTDVLRFTVVQDAGKAIHPSYVEGQMQGGSVQGIGWALNEEYYYSDDGRMNNPTFLDYRMPTSLDLPMIDTVIVEVANPGHPYGVRGVGEANIVSPQAAVANAIKSAVGTRMEKMPMNPAAIMEQLWS
ncbi:MAG: xanthine dehydrogenase family protein molybdopterin-binding subunit [SAR202 cluster bacterium]|nr:xanthine dehydrogenase family protein molybdopterin-binding subunit [SAR202 cluster bacterium]